MFRRELFELFDEGTKQTKDHVSNWNDALDYDLHAIPDHLILERMMSWATQNKFDRIAKVLEIKAVIYRNAYFHSDDCDVNVIAQSSVDLFSACLFYIKIGQKQYAMQMMKSHMLLAEAEFLRTQALTNRAEWTQILWNEYKSLFHAIESPETGIELLDQCQQQTTLYDAHEITESTNIVWEYYHRMISFTVYHLTQHWESLHATYEERLPLKVALLRFIHKQIVERL